MTFLKRLRAAWRVLCGKPPETPTENLAGGPGEGP